MRIHKMSGRQACRLPTLSRTERRYEAESTDDYEPAQELLRHALSGSQHDAPPRGFASLKRRASNAEYPPTHEVPEPFDKLRINSASGSDSTIPSVATAPAKAEIRYSRVENSLVSIARSYIGYAVIPAFIAPVTVPFTSFAPGKNHSSAS